jgi:hypothetical protein
VAQLLLLLLLPVLKLLPALLQRWLPRLLQQWQWQHLHSLR